MSDDKQHENRRPRCRHCGHRLLSVYIERCPECGGRFPPIVSRPWHAIRYELKGKLISAAFGCSMAALCALWIPLSHLVDSFELFYCAVLLTIVGLLATVVWILVMSGKWIALVLEAIWCKRDGNVGPWSGPGPRIVVYVILVVGQLALACALLMAVGLLPGEEPADWL